MALTEDDVARIAHLARIEISEADRRAMLAQLNDIFAMIEKMRRIDTAGVAPMAHPLGGQQRLREDHVTETDARQANMSNAPQAEDGLFLVRAWSNRKEANVGSGPRGVAELGRLLERKEVSAVELATLMLARIERHRGLNAFLDVRPEVTLAQAQAADTRRARGETGALLGVPIAHKDIFVTRGWASTASSKILEGYMSPFDATVVENLSRAGMVCLGKLNCDEFAMGSSNENSAYGNVLNPWDEGAVPGGSSGGSSASVAARLAPVATATDTGGSIREPAAFTASPAPSRPTAGRRAGG